MVDLRAGRPGQTGPQLSVGVLIGWGVDVIVSGRAIYDGRDPPGNLRRMLEQLRSAPDDSRMAAAAS